MGRPATLKVDIVADAKGFRKGVDEAEGKLGKLGRAAGPVGAAIGLGLAVGVGALVKFGAATVAAASQGEQSMGAIESVFGKAADAVKKFSKDSAMRLGLSKNSYRELAAVVGSQLQGMGRSQQQAARETDKLIALGADLAATFGGSVADAVSAVGSLLRGERDPIERYGVSIKAADIQARLAAQGQDKLTGAARKTAEANATLTLLTEKTKNSLGAFGRESNTLAGTQERLRAKFADLKEQLGNKLLPIVTRFAQYLLSDGVPALERMGKWIAANKDAFIALGTGVGQVLAVMAQGFLRFTASVLENLGRKVAAFRAFLNFFFAFSGTLLAAAAKAFGWLPGIGDKIRGAQGKLGELQTTANAKLSAVEGKFRASAAAASTAADKVGQIGAAIGRLRDKTVRVTTIHTTVQRAQRDGRGGGITAGAGGVYTLRPALVGGFGSFITAALGGSDTSEIISRSSATSTVVDSRSFPTYVTIEGALDAPAVARQLEQILRQHAVRLGRQTAYGAA